MLDDESYMDNEELPVPEFTPEGRKREYMFVREVQKGIRESKEIPEKEKSRIIKSCYSYLLRYEHEYSKYQRIQLEKIIHQALTILN